MTRHWRRKGKESFRKLTALVRARLYEQNPAFAGTDGEALAAESFRLALRHDPRLYQGRMEYVTLLLQRGNREEARQTLEEGVKYYYPDMPGLIPFYSLTAKLRHEAGDIEQAKVLEDKVAALKKLATGSYFLSAY